MRNKTILMLLLVPLNLLGATNKFVGVEHDWAPRNHKTMALVVPPDLVDTNAPAILWQVLHPSHKFLVHIQLDGRTIYRNYVHDTRDWDPGVRSFVRTRLKNGKYKLLVVNETTGKSAQVVLDTSSARTVTMSINRDVQVKLYEHEMMWE